uniref:Uncharacterized protein n=1 Tax=Xenopus tropicalis TaxID=8364 RepID=A0A310T3Z2_XENTR
MIGGNHSGVFVAAALRFPPWEVSLPAPKVSLCDVTMGQNPGTRNVQIAPPKQRNASGFAYDTSRTSACIHTSSCAKLRVAAPRRSAIVFAAVGAEEGGDRIRVMEQRQGRVHCRLSSRR